MKRAEVELKAQIDALLAKAKVTDEAEKNEPELDLPAEISRREDRLAMTRPRCWQRPEKEVTVLKYKFGEPKPNAQENFTDPESRVMKHAGGGIEYSYNAL